MMREDAFVDDHEWNDTGCDIAPLCLACPLPRCRYDAPGGLKSILAEMRHDHILGLSQGGMGVDDISRVMEISRRSVFRVLKHAKEGPLLDGPSESSHSEIHTD